MSSRNGDGKSTQVTSSTSIPAHLLRKTVQAPARKNSTLSEEVEHAASTLRPREELDFHFDKSFKQHPTSDSITSGKARDEIPVRFDLVSKSNEKNENMDSGRSKRLRKQPDWYQKQSYSTKEGSSDSLEGSVYVDMRPTKEALSRARDSIISEKATIHSSRSISNSSNAPKKPSKLIISSMSPVKLRKITSHPVKSKEDMPLRTKSKSPDTPRKRPVTRSCARKLENKSSLDVVEIPASIPDGTTVKKSVVTRSSKCPVGSEVESSDDSEFESSAIDSSDLGYASVGQRGGYGLRSRTRPESDSTDSHTSYGDRKRRNPHRAGRANPGDMAMPDWTLGDSDLEEPPNKKPRKVANGAASAETSHSYLFEPGFYFPTKETIGGCSSIKQELRQTILEPFRRQIQATIRKEELSASQIVKGALFWGPPGTGKTLMAKALAFECGLGLERAVPVYIISGAELLTKWVGESESHLREIFRQAGDNSPSMIFIDELDGLVRRRTNAETDGVNFNMVSTLLTLLNGVNDRGAVLVIATTNFKDAIDPALMRSGRFDNKIFFPAPDESERSLIIRAITAPWKHKINDENLKALARNTAHFTGADLELLCRRSKINAVDRYRKNTEIGPLENIEEPEVQPCDFFASLQKIQPATSGSNPLPYKPLHHLAGKLIQSQVDKMVLEICNHVPVKMSNATSTSSAAFAKFCCSSMLLDFNPIVYIHTDNHDPTLLTTLAQAIFNVLAVENTVKIFDFAFLASTNRPVPIELSTALRERSSVIGLFNIDSFSSNSKDCIEIQSTLRNILSDRDRLDSPVIIITSLFSPAAYGKEFQRIFGNNVVLLEAEPPNYVDCKEYLSEFILIETAKVIDEVGHITVLDDDDNFKKNGYEKKLCKLARHLAGRPIDVILEYHASLSRALWTDRMENTKDGFLKKLGEVVIECKARKPSAETPRKRGNQRKSYDFSNMVDTTSSTFSSETDD